MAQVAQHPIALYRARPTRVILASLIADGSLAVMKFVAAGFSGSAAMWAEAFHSLADTTNQSLLLLGRALAQRPADDAHPFGYGKERFFWPFMVSIVIFSVGGIFAFLRGIRQIQTPHPLAYLGWSYVILATAFVLEGSAWMVAWRELRRIPGRKPMWQLIHESKMPAVIAVFLQDAAAVIGVIIAAVGLGLAQWTGHWMLDGVASLMLGSLLFAIAWIIAVEARSLLLGESASPEVLAKIRDVIASTKDVERLIDLLTMHLGPEQILVNLDLEFKDGLMTEQIETAIDHIEREIRAAVPEVSKIFIEAESIAKVARTAGPTTEKVG